MPMAIIKCSSRPLRISLQKGNDGVLGNKQMRKVAVGLLDFDMSLDAIQCLLVPIGGTGTHLMLGYCVIQLHISGRTTPKELHV